MTTTEIKQQFLNALQRGTGEAYLIVKNNPKINFSNQIIKGVLNIYAYDGQSEGDRAKYIFDIISISRQKDKIRKALFQGLAAEKDNPWNLTHLFALAKLYAQQNDIEAKQAIYDRFLTNPIEGTEWIGAHEILELDGLNGMFFIAEKFGKYIEQNPEHWQDDWIIEHFQNENKNIKVYEELRMQAKTNKFICAYLDNIKQTKSRYKANSVKTTRYENLVDEVTNSNSFISYKRIRNLTDEEIGEVARHLLIENNQVKIEKLLRVFDFHKFPLNNQIILDFAKQKSTNKNRIVEYAIYALKHLNNKNIRDFALDKIQNTKNPIDYLEILKSNYKCGDAILLNDIAKKVNNEHDIEQLAEICVAIYKANKTKECREPLETLYYKMNCAIHRKDIVEILIANNVLSDKIKNEIKFDSWLETRNLLK